MLLKFLYDNRIPTTPDRLNSFCNRNGCSFTTITLLNLFGKELLKSQGGFSCDRRACLVRHFSSAPLWMFCEADNSTSSALVVLILDALEWLLLIVTELFSLGMIFSEILHYGTSFSELLLFTTFLLFLLLSTAGDFFSEKSTLSTRAFSFSFTNDSCIFIEGCECVGWGLHEDTCSKWHFFNFSANFFSRMRSLFVSFRAGGCSTTLAKLLVIVSGNTNAL